VPKVGKLDGKVALITGAGSGIGRATALLFAREGAKVVVVDYVPSGGEETVGMIKGAGGESFFIEADVSKSVDVKRMVDKTVETYRRIDILYNNAGVDGEVACTDEVTEEEWDRVINVNLKGVFLGSKYTIPVMLEQGGGVIISTASMLGLIGCGGMPAYCASKGGVVQLTKTMALEYARRNIRINCICAGIILTALSEPLMPLDPEARQAAMKSHSPMERIGLPEEIAQAALYLASDESAFVTGTAFVVDGGFVAGIQRARSRAR